MTEQSLDRGIRPQFESRGGGSWHSAETAPYDLDLELAVIDDDGPHALVFPCQRIEGGWIDVTRGARINVRPTHWREWRRLTCD
jgi:hypothetical protein